MEIFVIVVLAIVVVAGIGYYALKNGQINLIPEKQTTISPTPTKALAETANWKTYMNKEIGISISIPNELEIETEGTDQMEGKWTTIFSNKLLQVTVSQFEDNRKVSKPYGEPEPLSKDNLYYLCPNMLTESINIQGRTAIRCVATTDGFLISDNPIVVGQTVNYYIIDGKRSFRVWVTSFDTTKVKQEVLDQILSTFKFLPSMDSGKLLEIYSHGGLCPNGECRLSTIITTDGKVMVNGNLETTLISNEITKLRDLINGADFTSIKSIKFTGTCPTAYDGQERIYTFYTDRGTETISSCEVAIDYTSPLFSEITQILSQP